MIDSLKDYKEIVEKLHLRLGDVDIKMGDSRKVVLPENSIDGIITSQLYSIALDYAVNNEDYYWEDSLEKEVFKYAS